MEILSTKQEALKARLYQIQGGRCFICGLPIDLQLQKTDIDHIIPRAREGKDDENNYALTHLECNRSKQDSDLRVARCMSTYNAIKDKYSQKGPNNPNLGDFLSEKNGAKYDLAIKVNNDFIEYSQPDIESSVHRVPLYKDKLAGMSYFFAELPLEYIHHDDLRNPRAVSPRIRGLVAEFLQKRPQLHLSLGWVKVKDGRGKIYVFDGQHKAVSQILLGATKLTARVFIDPDLDVLLEANTNAGTSLRQVAFDLSVQRLLGSKIYWEKIDEYRQIKKLPEGDLSFSEKDLLQFYKGQQREIRRYILDDVRTRIISSPENKLKDYIEFGGRASEKPLSYSTVEKTFYSFFIHKEPLDLPINFNYDIDENPRQLEISQVIGLMNVISEEIFQGRFDFDLGAGRVEEKLRKGEQIPDDHLRAVRIVREEVLYNWLKYVQALIKRKYLYDGRPVSDEDLFQQKFSPQLWEQIRKLIRSISDLPVWISRNDALSANIFGGKQTNEYWKSIFDTGKTPSNIPVLAKGLNIDELLI